MKTFTAVLSLLIIGLIVSYQPLFPMSSAQSTKDESTPVKIILTLWPPNFLAYLAQEKGLFEKNGVNVELLFDKDYVRAVERYDDNEADGITIVFSDAIIQDSNGIPTKIVYNIDSSQTGDAIVSKLKNLTDLMGKKIGVEGINSFSHLFALKALEKAGLGEGNVEFVNIAGANTTAALESGQIDAGHTYSPFLEDAKAKGYNILVTAKQNPGIIVSVLAFHSDIVKNRPQDIKNILKSLIDALNYYKENREEALQIMSTSSGLSKEEIIRGFNGTKLMTLHDNVISLANKSGDMNSLYTSGQYASNFFTQRGVMSDYADIGAIVDPQFVRAISSEEKSFVVGNSLK